MAFCSVTFLTEALKRPINIEVILPTDKMAVKGTHIPEKKPMKTLYLLEGLMSNCTGGVRYTTLQGMAEDNNCAVVVVDSANKWYANNTNKAGEDYNDLIWKDLINFTRQSFNLSDKREETFIGGFSMGGGGALIIGMQHPELFSHIITSSAAPVDTDSTNAGQTFGTTFGMEGIEDYNQFAEYIAKNMIKSLRFL